MHDDCYFFLYSECKLKERCRYRHNPLSKDHLILCKIWSKNKKCRLDCPLRHSLYHVVKQRSDTMCYWEDKGGCTKYRCEFKHLDASKDEWKEPKVKLLTEIIETREKLTSTPTLSSIKEIHMSTDDILKVSNEDFKNINKSKSLNENSIYLNVNSNKSNDLQIDSTISVKTPETIVSDDLTLSEAPLAPTMSQSSLSTTNVVYNSELSQTNSNDIKSFKPDINTNLVDNNRKDVDKIDIFANQQKINKIDEKQNDIIFLKKTENYLPEKRKYVDNETANKCSNLKKSKCDITDIDIENLDKEIEDLDNLLNFT